MIVISHPWEFVPKGCTYLNTLSSSGSSATTAQASTIKSNEAAKIGNDVGSGSSTDSSSQQQQQGLPHPSAQSQPPLFYLQKSHVNRILQNQNISVSGKVGKSGAPPSSEDSSLSDISFAYLHKSPLVNRINFDTNVCLRLFLCTDFIFLRQSLLNHINQKKCHQSLNKKKVFLKHLILNI